MTKALAGKTVIVTGASQGIGLAVAKRLSFDGANLALTYLPEHGQADEVIAQIGVPADRALVVTGDLRQPHFVSRLFEETENRFGKPDIVAAIAGVNLSRPVVDTTEEDYDRIFSSIPAPHSVFSVRPRAKIRDGGRIIGDLKQHGLAGTRWPCALCGKQGSCRAIRQNARKGARPRGITVNAVAPGPTDTAMVSQFSRRHGAWHHAARKAGPAGGHRRRGRVFWRRKTRAGLPDRSSASTAESSEAKSAGAGTNTRHHLHPHAKIVAGTPFVWFSTNAVPRGMIMSSEQLIQGIIGGLAIGCIYSLIALGITIIIRATEILHFAQGELMMIGAMAGLSAMWMVDLPFILVLFVGMIGGGVAAVAIELSIYRTLRVARAPHQHHHFNPRCLAHSTERGAADMGIGASALPAAIPTRGIDIAGFAISPQLIWIVGARLRDDGGSAAVFSLYPSGHCDAGGGAGCRSCAANGHQREKDHHLHIHGGWSDGGRGRRAAGIAVFCFVQYGISHWHQGIRGRDAGRSRKSDRGDARRDRVRSHRNVFRRIDFDGVQRRSWDGRFDRNPVIGPVGNIHSRRPQDLSLAHAVRHNQNSRSGLVCGGAVHPDQHLLAARLRCRTNRGYSGAWAAACSSAWRDCYLSGRARFTESALMFLPC